MNDFEERMIGRAVGGLQNVGRLPTHAEMSKQPLAERTQKVRVLVDGWYGPNRLPVEVGDVLKLRTSDAQIARDLGRAEYVT